VVVGMLDQTDALASAEELVGESGRAAGGHCRCGAPAKHGASGGVQLLAVIASESARYSERSRCVPGV
jgi:hypothetical protein